MSFILTRPHKPHHVVRLYQFPYRVGMRKGTEHLWRPDGKLPLTTNLKAEFDTQAVNQKFIRLGVTICLRDLFIVAISVANFEEDVIEVTAETSPAGGRDVWMEFSKILSTSFCLPVRL